MDFLDDPEGMTRTRRLRASLHSGTKAETPDTARGPGHR